MSLAEEGTRKRLAFFDRIVNEKLVYILYQPIYHIENRSEVFGFEALTRIKVPSSYKRVDDVFRDARQLGRLHELESASSQFAIERMASFSKGYPLFLNMEPSSLSDDKLLKKIVALSRRMNLPLSNIVIELTEREIITNFEHVRSALAPYRKEGLKLAVDDLGEGYSRLRSVIELEPEYIKIDRNIVSNVHRHKLKQRIISAIVEASKDFSHVIAEGIENAEELRMLQKIGLKFGQGFFLGRPGKLQE